MIEKCRLLFFQSGILKKVTRHIHYTGKLRFNKSEGAKDFVLYSKDCVIGGAFYYEINYSAT
jgi:hypothetical protein